MCNKQYVFMSLNLSVEMLDPCHLVYRDLALEFIVFESALKFVKSFMEVISGQ